MNDEPDERANEYRADEGRKLVCAQLGHDLAERHLAKGAIGDCDDQHWDPGEYIAGQVSESFPDFSQLSNSGSAAGAFCQSTGTRVRHSVTLADVSSVVHEGIPNHLDR